MFSLQISLMSLKCIFKKRFHKFWVIVHEFDYVHSKNHGRFAGIKFSCRGNKLLLLLLRLKKISLLIRNTYNILCSVRISSSYFIITAAVSSHFSTLPAISSLPLFSCFSPSMIQFSSFSLLLCTFVFS